MVWFLIFIQIIDVAVHIATDQVETLRIISNSIIVLWAGWLIHKTNKLLDYGLVGSYILLTLFFIMLNGITNDGSPRIFFLGSVTITLAISALLILKKK